MTMKLSLLFLLATVLQAGATRPRCPSNQQYLAFVQVGCPASCDQPVPLCFAPVGPGCGCPKGLVVAGTANPDDPLRCIEPSQCRRCPSNQEYLPAVQFGCPASCDQPVPLCKAAIGPGCGCPKGLVVAGTALPRDPERCISPKECPRCPANQQFLPNVQYGCPKSCDQPVIQCRASTGPGCGCPDGQVLAGSTRPLSPDVCIGERSCELERKCPIGTPLLGSDQKQLVCGPDRPSCPRSSECQLARGAKYGVCCSAPKPEPKICEVGNPLVGSDGMQLFCGRGTSRVECPYGSSCIIDPTDRFAVCCADPLPPKICEIGFPLVGDDGKQLFCGRGPSRVDCPYGSSCVIHPADAYAVCCAEPMLPPPPPPTCVVSGCNKEVCAPEPLASICLAPTCEMACLRFATCEASNTRGDCGWNTSSPKYEECIGFCLDTTHD